MSACRNVDLPEPVLPATSMCCAVPLPNRACCSFVAPARPSGTSSPLRLSDSQRRSFGGAIFANATSTRPASLDASPTFRTIRETTPGSGNSLTSSVSVDSGSTRGGPSALGFFASSSSISSGSRRTSSDGPSAASDAAAGRAGLYADSASLQRYISKCPNSSDTSSPCGSAAEASCHTSTNTPHRGPLAATLISRRQARSVKRCGNPLTIRNRYGSATSPAARLYSSIVPKSPRRYVCRTFSMCSVRSARRASIWFGSVQIRPPTARSS